MSSLKSKAVVFLPTIQSAIMVKPVRAFIIAGASPENKRTNNRNILSPERSNCLPTSFKVQVSALQSLVDRGAFSTAIRTSVWPFSNRPRKLWSHVIELSAPAPCDLRSHRPTHRSCKSGRCQKSFVFRNGALSESHRLHSWECQCKKLVSQFKTPESPRSRSF